MSECVSGSLPAAPLAQSQFHLLPRVQGVGRQRHSLSLPDSGGVVVVKLMEGLTLAGTANGPVHVVDSDKHTLKGTLSGHTEKVTDIAVESSGACALSTCRQAERERERKREKEGGRKRDTCTQICSHTL